MKDRIYKNLKECEEEPHGLWSAYASSDTPWGGDEPETVEILKEIIIADESLVLYDDCVRDYYLSASDRYSILRDNAYILSSDDDAVMGKCIREGNVNDVVIEILSAFFEVVLEEAVEGYLKDNGYYDSTTEQIDEDYDEGFNDIEESLKRKGWR